MNQACVPLTVCRVESSQGPLEWSFRSPPDAEGYNPLAPLRQMPGEHSDPGAGLGFGRLGTGEIPRRISTDPDVPVLYRESFAGFWE